MVSSVLVVAVATGFWAPAVAGAAGPITPMAGQHVADGTQLTGTCVKSWVVNPPPTPPPQPKEWKWTQGDTYSVFVMLFSSDWVGMGSTASTLVSDCQDNPDPIVAGPGSWQMRVYSTVWNCWITNYVDTGCEVASHTETIVPFTVDGPSAGGAPPKRFTDRQKAALLGLADEFNDLAAEAAIAGVLALAVPDPSVSKVAAIVFGVGSGASWLAGNAAGRLARDPADADYTTVVRVGRRVPPKLRPGRAIPAAAARALNRAMANWARGASLAVALDTTVSRAQAASAAGAPDWEQVQMSAAAGFADKWATSLRRSSALNKNAYRALRETTLGKLSITAHQALRAQDVIRSRFPSALKRVLRTVGLTRGQIRRARDQWATFAAPKSAWPAASVIYERRRQHAARVAARALEAFADDVRAGAR
jgi:hypothetical protein